MELGYCRGGRASRYCTEILINPVSVRWNNPKTGYWAERQNAKFSESLITATKRNIKWTDEELEKLYEMDHIPAVEVARILGRTFWSVNHMRRKKIRRKWAQKS